MKYFYAACLVLIFMLARVSVASTSGAGSIKLIHATSNGALIFYHDGARSNDVPACAKNYSTRWVIDETTEGGKAQVSALLTAYSLNKKISVVGLGDCGIWDNTETVKWFVIVDGSS